MITRRFLLYFDTVRAKGPVPGDLYETAMRSVEAPEVTVSATDDLTVIQGEPCLAIEVTGTDDAIETLTSKWDADRLRIEDADRQVHELDDDPSDQPG